MKGLLKFLGCSAITCVENMHLSDIPSKLNINIPNQDCANIGIHMAMLLRYQAFVSFFIFEVL